MLTFLIIYALLVMFVLAACFVARESRIPENPFRVRGGNAPSAEVALVQPGDGRELSPAVRRDLLARSAGAFRKWLAFKRVCAWCQPMRYLGGNPFAKQTTHGMCGRCLAEVERQLEAEKRLPRGRHIESIFAELQKAHQP